MVGWSGKHCLRSWHLRKTKIPDGGSRKAELQGRTEEQKGGRPVLPGVVGGRE